ncbi:HlyD family efflux transporter periplasmic adaptor subunit [Psychromonas algicola]|uniref:HlyD family efflux transporter periplasmic adaptor subunit n=1 Tax=Psychromonas algicola TaxID=2555642 RepID=UPI001067C0C5|nr:HlyD family efflux transporter periplasmic adaptor subunit [Psychromonas sp. RZ5]TEW51729.1 HlyD family efflux transporter periplasmic adaptor subunit [Psychromonas sp. RZ5]
MNEAKVNRLENYYREGKGILLIVLLASLVSFYFWATSFRIDEVAKATGEIISSSRVQIIQAVDGGVISELNVKEGDLVKAGDILARLDTTRIQASVSEVEAKLFAVKARAIRLRAEVVGEDDIFFPIEFDEKFKETAIVEKALFKQRRKGFLAGSSTLSHAVNLAKEELEILNKLFKEGDVSALERLHAKRSLNEAEAKLINYKNQFLEDARIDLAKAEDDIAQNQQIFNRRDQEKQDSIFVALVPGVVKNVRVTTVGGVLSAGEEIMQIVPLDDELIVETKVLPADIAQVHKEQSATIRFDAYDYTIYGVVKGKVIYVSADTLKEETSNGTEIYYRVHVSPDAFPVVTSAGHSITVLPGMTAQVDIRSGDRTLMDYLLKPLRKTLFESFNER